MTGWGPEREGGGGGGQHGTGGVWEGRSAGTLTCPYSLWARLAREKLCLRLTALLLRPRRRQDPLPIRAIVGGRALGNVLVPSWRHIGDTQRSSVANVSRRGANCVEDGSTMGARRQRISIRPCRFLA